MIFFRDSLAAALRAQVEKRMKSGLIQTHAGGDVGLSAGETSLLMRGKLSISAERLMVHLSQAGVSITVALDGKQVQL